MDTEYYVIPQSETSDEQHVYVGTDLEVPGVEGSVFVTELIADDAKNFVKVTKQDGDTDYIVLTAPGVRVLSLPEDVKSESENRDSIAPYRVACDWDDTDDTLYYKFSEAEDAAEEHASLDGHNHDSQVVNAYNNDLEYYEAEEEDEDTYDGPDTLEEKNDFR